jgi:hypothetical protein
VHERHACVRTYSYVEQLPSERNNACRKCMQGDINDAEALVAAIKQAGDVVISATGHSSPEEVESQLRIVAAIKEAGNVRVRTFTSSAYLPVSFSSFSPACNYMQINISIITASTCILTTDRCVCSGSCLLNTAATWSMWRSTWWSRRGASSGPKSESAMLSKLQGFHTPSSAATGLRASCCQELGTLSCQTVVLRTPPPPSSATDKYKVYSLSLLLRACVRACACSHHDHHRLR